MADGAYRFHQAGPGQGPYFYPPHNQQVHHQRHLVRNSSPVNSGRAGYNNETPSPSRSPVSQITSHNSFNMYNQSQQPGQHSLINGGTNHRFMQMNAQHKYPQHQSHQQHPSQQTLHQQNHGGHHAHGNLSHQHTFSSGMISSSTPNFTPNGLHNGAPDEDHEDTGEPTTEHWQFQIQRAADSRQSAPVSHRHSRKEGVTRVSRGSLVAATEESQKDGDLLERHRATSVLDHQRQDWDGLDLSGQGIRNVSVTLFDHYAFLDKLYIDGNKLGCLPPAIGQLRNLSLLEASHNDLRELPEAIGMLVNLKELYVFDNNISTLPYEVGYLYKLFMLGIEGNPLDEEFKEIVMRYGTKALVVHLRDTMEAGPPPRERELVVPDASEASEKFSVLDFNILGEYCATTALYGYTPSQALSWEYRRDLILEEIKKRDADIVCLQEVNMETYNEFFRRELASHFYKGAFWPRSRARTMAEKEARLVDGCATFYKVQKYIMLDKQVIDFANAAINRPDMKGEHDIFNRVMPRDHIAVVTFFENRVTGSRMIVVNTHIYWDPAFTDVKLVQVAILMEQVTKLADRWATFPPCTDKQIFRHTEQDNEMGPDIPEELQLEYGPSLEYSTGSQIPLVVCGDFNSEQHTGVYNLLNCGALSGDHPDLDQRGYGNLTRDGMAHPFTLKSAYSDEMAFTNYTPGYTGIVDYIWHSSNSLKVKRLLGDVDKSHLQKIPGFPNFYFPSDHLPLFVEFSVEPRKERPKAVEADFGSQRHR